MLETFFRIDNPDAMAGRVAGVLRGQPCRCDFLLARIAQGIGSGVEREEAFGFRNAAANLGSYQALIGNIRFVQPDTNAGAGESIQQRPRSLQILPAIAEEQIGRHTVATR
jgi:hypothetical protein